MNVKDFLIRNIPSIIDHEGKNSFQSIPKEKEVFEAIFSFDGDKALG